MKARVGIVLALLIAASAANAQQMKVQVPRGPHYLGDAIDLRVTAEGFEEDPPPQIEVTPPRAGSLRLIGVSPNVSTSVVFDGVNTVTRRSVTFAYTYQFRATEEGAYQVGPFRITQGGVERTAPAVRLNVKQAPKSDRLGVSLTLPKAPIYVGERVPIRLSFRLENELQKNLQSYTLEVPFFDTSKHFRFIDEPDAEGETDVVVQTSEETLRFKGHLSRRAGFLVVTVERTLMALAEGAFGIEPSTLFVEEGVRWRRDFFGGRRATHVRRLQGSDGPQTLTVKGLPLAGRPPGFAGAVGAGYDLEVAADRTVVQVGEPITLTLSLRGAGNLESASLPRLDAEGMLTPRSFRVPDGDLTGTLDGATKRFTAVVRVLDDSVTEIPALAYAWFDPKTETYQSTQSRPIALAVRSAEVIGAADVVSDEPAPARAEALPPDASPGGAPRARSFALTGADLAIVREPALLLASGSGLWDNVWMPVGLYSVSILAVGLALVDRRRRNVDPALLRRRALASVEMQRVRDAASLPSARAASELARALRRLLAECPDARSAELDAFLGECDARSYAPEGMRDDSALDEAFHARAARLARQLVESSS